MYAIRLLKSKLSFQDEINDFSNIFKYFVSFGDTVWSTDLKLRRTFWSMRMAQQMKQTIIKEITIENKRQYSNGYIYVEFIEMEVVKV